MQIRPIFLLLTLTFLFSQCKKENTPSPSPETVDFSCTDHPAVCNLTAANGNLISQTSASNASYAGADTSGMALTLINESADEVVATLYGEYCRRDGTQ